MNYDDVLIGLLLLALAGALYLVLTRPRQWWLEAGPENPVDRFLDRWFGPRRPPRV
jgi:hypothetical protein